MHAVTNLQIAMPKAASADKIEKHAIMIDKTIKLSPPYSVIFLMIHPIIKTIPKVDANAPSAKSIADATNILQFLLNIV